MASLATLPAAPFPTRYVAVNLVPGTGRIPLVCPSPNSRYAVPSVSTSGTNACVAGPMSAWSRSSVTFHGLCWPPGSTPVSEMMAGTGVPCGPTAAAAGWPASGTGAANVSGALASAGRNWPWPAGGTTPIASGPELSGSSGVPMLRPWSASTTLPQATDTRQTCRPPCSASVTEDTHNGNVRASAASQSISVTGQPLTGSVVSVTLVRRTAWRWSGLASAGSPVIGPFASASTSTMPGFRSGYALCRVAWVVPGGRQDRESLQA
jgi:hypothetical protein